MGLPVGDAPTTVVLGLGILEHCRFTRSRPNRTGLGLGGAAKLVGWAPNSAPDTCALGSGAPPTHRTRPVRTGCSGGGLGGFRVLGALYLGE